MSFRTDKIRGAHPITPKKGIKEVDLNIKEKGSNDRIVVKINPAISKEKKINYYKIFNNFNYANKWQYLAAALDRISADQGEINNRIERENEKLAKEIILKHPTLRSIGKMDYGLKTVNEIIDEMKNNQEGELRLTKEHKRIIDEYVKNNPYENIHNLNWDAQMHMKSDTFKKIVGNNDSNMISDLINEYVHKKY